jgi:Cft2 family RNA processing exonuclease
MALIVDGKSVALDTKEASAEMSFISHAHSDHTRAAKAENIISSIETAELIKARTGREVKTMQPPKFMQLLDSGHILGSKQLFVRSEELGLDITYTGDYQLQESAVANKIQLRSTDIAILDSTYPYPKIRFDPREEVTYALQKYVAEKLEKGVVLFGAYSIGKAQELISIMNDAGIVPVVDTEIAKLSATYNKFGSGLDYCYRYDNEERFNESVRGNFAAITTMSRIDSIKERLARKYAKRVFSGVATGFAKIFRFKTDVQFALSDHADFSQAMRYIEETGAKRVYTYGGNSELFAKHLGNAGIRAEPFKHGSFNVEPILAKPIPKQKSTF